MVHRFKNVFLVLFIGIFIQFPSSGIVGTADAETSPNERGTESIDRPSVHKRQGQSPAPKREAASSDTREYGATSVGKRQGQSPANKRTTKGQASEIQENNNRSDDSRHGQSPGNK